MIYPLVCGHDSWWGVEQGAVNGARRVAFRMNEEGSDHLPPPAPSLCWIGGWSWLCKKENCNNASKRDLANFSLNGTLANMVASMRRWR